MLNSNVSFKSKQLKPTYIIHIVCRIVVLRVLHNNNVLWQKYSKYTYTNIDISYLVVLFAHNLEENNIFLQL